MANQPKPVQCSMTIAFYSDPGHGWAKVHIDHLYDFGVENKITPYSYQRGSWVYLEEDCDLSTFVRAANDHGVGIKFKQASVCRTRPSQIRNYNSYQTPNGVPYQYQFQAA